MHVDNSLELQSKHDNIVIADCYILISLDVVSLFPNVNEELIYLAIEKRWPILFNSINISFSLFVKTIKHILTNNFFTFNNTYYKQIFASAMGNPIMSKLSKLHQNYVLMYRSILDMYRRHITLGTDTSN